MTKRKKEYPWEKSYPKGIDWNANIYPEPLYGILDKSAKNFPDNNCLDYYGRKYSYAEILDLSNKFAAGLQKHGVQKGDKVGLLLPNCPLFVVAYFGALKAGAIVVNYNPLYTVNELGAQVKDSGTRILVTLDLRLLYEKAANLLQTSSVEKIIVGNFKGMLPFPKDWLFGLLKSSEIATVSYGRINISVDDLLDNDGNYNKIDIKPEEDLAVLQYTGGTTGTPKGAMLTHANLHANTIQTGMWFDGLEEGNEVMMGVLPFFHVFAMTVVMNLSIYKACEIILHARLDVGNLLKDVARKKVTLLPGVPTLFTAINNHKKAKSNNLSSLKFCISGGAPLPLEVKEKFESMSDCTLIEGYGLTESSPVVVANPLFGENKKGSIGIPLPGTTIEIRDVEGRRTLMPKDKIGEICVKGPQVMQGYLNNNEETEEVLISGRLHTGDMGYMDKDGYIYVVDRLKEMIISSGFNVYPREVEEEIYKHAAVEEASVVGVDSSYRGQNVKAFVKLKLGHELTEAQLKDFLKGKLAKYKLPSEIEFIEEMPKTLIGKISKKALVGDADKKSKAKKKTRAKKKTAAKKTTTKKAEPKSKEANSNKKEVKKKVVKKAPTKKEVVKSS